jgi:hypothetical protein
VYNLRGIASISMQIIVSVLSVIFDFAKGIAVNVNYLCIYRSLSVLELILVVNGAIFLPLIVPFWLYL